MTGFVSPPSWQVGLVNEVVATMANAIRHRGPDDVGTWLDESAGIALGHRCLSAFDLSPAGNQPMTSTCGHYLIALNVEIHIHQLHGLLRCARIQGEWRGHLDPESLLAGFLRGVEETLHRAVGMFAIALWGRGSLMLTLARDRMGEKPLYYGWQRDTFLFDSELNALKVHPAFVAGIDRGALALLLRHNYVPARDSFYEVGHKLSAGSEHMTETTHNILLCQRLPKRLAPFQKNE